jgi:hypothetical protein
MGGSNPPNGVARGSGASQDQWWSQADPQPCVT